MKKFIICLCMLGLLTGCSKEIVDQPNIGEKPKEEEKIPYEGKMVTIYVFYGEGCPHCEELFNYLEQLEDEYGKYYHVIKYETWYNSENNNLMNQVATYLEDTIKGVPYYIIGNVSINGYSANFQEKIKNTIQEQFYNRDYVDVIDAIKNNE